MWKDHNEKKKPDVLKFHSTSILLLFIITPLGKTRLHFNTFPREKINPPDNYTSSETCVNETSLGLLRWRRNKSTGCSLADMLTFYTQRTLSLKHTHLHPPIEATRFGWKVRENIWEESKQNYNHRSEVMK